MYFTETGHTHFCFSFCALVVFSCNRLRTGTRHLLVCLPLWESPLFALSGFQPPCALGLCRLAAGGCRGASVYLPAPWDAPGLTRVLLPDSCPSDRPVGARGRVGGTSWWTLVCSDSVACSRYGALLSSFCLSSSLRSVRVHMLQCTHGLFSV